MCVRAHAFAVIILVKCIQFDDLLYLYSGKGRERNLEGIRYITQEIIETIQKSTGRVSRSERHEVAGGG